MKRFVIGKLLITIDTYFTPKNKVENTPASWICYILPEFGIMSSGICMAWLFWSIWIESAKLYEEYEAE